MSAAVTLDTSGAVELQSADAMRSPAWAESGVARWSDLDAFTQGYIEALLRDAPVRFGSPKDDPPLARPRNIFAAFSDLAPETLALILKDCEAIQRQFETWIHHTDMGGGRAWAERQGGKLKGFPPLTPYLGDDGLVYLRPPEPPMGSAAVENEPDDGADPQNLKDS